MPNTYFALCWPNDQMSVRRLDTHAGVQISLDQMFDQQDVDFRATIQNEIEFTGDWKPDDDEALYVNIPDQVAILTDAVENNSLAIQSLDAENFGQERIRAVFSGRLDNGQTRILIQKFSAQQLLGHKFTLMLSGDVLNELTEPAFTLDNKLVGIIEAGILKFKNFHNIRSIFDLSDLYREATNQDIDLFAAHACLEVPNLDAFKSEVDQTARKLIHAIQKNGTLDLHTVHEIQQRAALVGLVIEIPNGCVQMPTERGDIKRILRFLHDDIYEAPLSQQRYVSNSKKPE
jgi:hypothetical protein